MQKETRMICYDEELALESYILDGIVQAFPNHFHDFYVVGYMVAGQRFLSCKGMEYTLKPGDIVLFNPQVNHGCAQCGSEPLHYLGINIPKATMQKLALEITGDEAMPHFSQTVVQNEDAAQCLVPFHNAVMTNSREFEKEEQLFFLLTILIREYSAPFAEVPADCNAEIEQACHLMDTQYAEPLTLAQLCNCAGLSKSTLLRAFTQVKGMTPYRYLQTVRIGNAKKLLEQGATLMDAALGTGFYDQSHFSKFFTQFIGLAPGSYRDIFKHSSKGENVHEREA
ncbi:HTH-type transcriptional activator RhaR [bioreactor metagenome]|uniref:HTH-type transcriptional activator RhaR n=1 Tax=bioreactor metagenome TaxID=1076179 RepID=A0A644Y4B1_9ZZZZ